MSAVVSSVTAAGRLRPGDGWRDPLGRPTVPVGRPSGLLGQCPTVALLRCLFSTWQRRRQAGLPDFVCCDDCGLLPPCRFPLKVPLSFPASTCRLPSMLPLTPPAACMLPWNT